MIKCCYNDELKFWNLPNQLLSIFMKPFLCAILIVLTLSESSAAVTSQQKSSATTIELRSGLIITKSVKIQKRAYHLPAPKSSGSAVIIVRGNDITVDFAGATLEGIDPETDPDQAQGVALRIEGGSNVRILHAHIRGYKIGILVQNTHDLQLTDNDISYNWKPRLFSIVEHESLVDWLSFHHDEKNEWLRYGGGIFLVGVHRGVVSGNNAVQEMNGLMMTRCDHIRIEDNNFSFNSGLGIGLYRSSYNSIIRNRLDYNIRGYSHRFFRRGQDSAGLLMYEQSSNNVVAYNSVTHGGDGLFVWAGQSTMDSGTGGVNDNLFYGNDFSFAAANGIEATFSRNIFVSNRAEGCDYGVWGGYSFESKIIGNNLSHNRVGVAIEHGLINSISYNRFDGNATAISLWADSIENSDWGYAKYCDTKSRSYQIKNNVFDKDSIGVQIKNTDTVLVANNRWFEIDSTIVARDTSCIQFSKNKFIHSKDHSQPIVPREYTQLIPKLPDKKTKIPDSELAHRDCSAIIVDEWGPYDRRSPKLYPAGSSYECPLHLRTLGPPGIWKVVVSRGVAWLSQAVGKIGDTIVVRPDSTGDWELTLEYRGTATVSPSGIEKKAGQPYRFSYSRFDPPIDWNVRFFAWDGKTDPRYRVDAFDSLRRSNPILTLFPSRLDYEWYRPLIPELPQEHFAFEATANITFAPGLYTLRTISDDAVHLWIDDMLVIDDWMPHGSRPDYASIAGGKHTLRVQYYQVDGWTEFRLDTERGMNRSTGSSDAP